MVGKMALHADDNGGNTHLDGVEIASEKKITSIELLLIFLANDENIANDLKDKKIQDISTKVEREIESGRDSMQDWQERVDWGQSLLKTETKARNKAFEGSANFKSPVIKEAGIKFASRASTELLRHEDLVKINIVGPDDDNLRRDRGDRVATHMNYQINHVMDWREMHDKMLYELPDVGNVFKKTFFNSITERNETQLIHYPNFIINNTEGSNVSLENDPFTEIIFMRKNQIKEMQLNGLWIDDDNKLLDGIDDENEEDNEFFEHYSWFDLDDDGYEEPYIFTVHKNSNTVVRIVKRYSAEDIFVKSKKAGKKIRLSTLLEKNEQGETKLNIAQEKLGISLEDMQVVRISPLTIITKYSFIPSSDGSYLDTGYFHLLGALVESINSTANQLLDAGTLANLPSGILSKAFRKAKNLLRFKPGEFKSSDMSGQDLQQGIFTFPFKGPDQVLLAMNENSVAQARQLSASPDFNSAMQANAPATTTLALLMEQMSDNSAIIGRVHRSMSNEFSILFRLNGLFTDPEEYQDITNDQNADYLVDYNDDSIDVIPTASPEMSTKMERIQTAEVVLAQVDRVKGEGGNALPLLEDYFSAIGKKELFDEAFTQTEGQATAAQQIEQQQQQLLQTQQEQTQQQLDLMERNVSMGEQEQTRKDTETAAKLDQNEIEQERKNLETMSKDMLNHADALLKEAQTLLTTEETESEAVKNQIDIFTTQFKAAIDKLNLTKGVFSDQQANRTIGTGTGTNQGQPRRL